MMQDAERVAHRRQESRIYDNTACSFKVNHHEGAVGTTDEVTLTPVEAVDLIGQLIDYVNQRGWSLQLIDGGEP